MSQSTNTFSESPIMRGLLKMIDLAEGRPDTAIGRQPRPECGGLAEHRGLDPDLQAAPVADFLEHLVAAVQERLVAEVSDAIVGEVTDRLLAELPWRVADEVNNEFDGWVSGVARDLADEVAGEFDGWVSGTVSDLADTLRELAAGD